MWHTYTSSIVCTPIDNGKFTNKIATLLPIMVKNNIFKTPTCNIHLQRQATFSSLSKRTYKALNSQKWSTCNFSLLYPYHIQQMGNKNTQTYQVELVILI